MIKILKTNVSDPIVAKYIMRSIISINPSLRVDFYLDDVDRILRIEGELFEVETIINCLHKFGHTGIDLPVDLS